MGENNQGHKIKHVQVRFVRLCEAVAPARTGKKGKHHPPPMSESFRVTLRIACMQDQSIVPGLHSQGERIRACMWQH